MKKAICIHNATVLTGFSVMKNCAVYIKENKIVDVFSETRFLQKEFNPKVQIINAGGAYVAPGFMDTHIHGIGGYGTDDGKAESILKMSEILPQYGVTSFIPTIYAGKEDEMIRNIKAILKAMGKEKGAHILGMHLEGPFISPKRLGVQSENAISPVDMKLMEKLYKAAKGHIINMTVAPELKNMRELALYCISKGIVLQAGHTDANYNQWLKACRPGLCTPRTCLTP